MWWERAHLKLLQCIPHPACQKLSRDRAWRETSRTHHIDTTWGQHGTKTSCSCAWYWSWAHAWQTRSWQWHWSVEATQHSCSSASWQQWEVTWIGQATQHRQTCCCWNCLLLKPSVLGTQRASCGHLELIGFLWRETHSSEVLGISAE